MHFSTFFKRGTKTNSMEKSWLRQILREKGADLVGISSCREYFPEYTTAVTLGVSALRIYEMQKKDAIQALNETMDLLNVETRQILAREGYGSWGSLFSQEEGSRSRTVIPHRELAVKAGLGVIGKNFLLITPEFGPRIQFTTVLTTMPMLPDLPSSFNPCRTCDICVEKCPADALRTYFHEELCIKCYICVLVCPVGRDFQEIQRYTAEKPIWPSI